MGMTGRLCGGEFHCVVVT